MPKACFFSLSYKVSLFHRKDVLLSHKLSLFHKKDVSQSWWYSSNVVTYLCIMRHYEILKTKWDTRETWNSKTVFCINLLVWQLRASILGTELHTRHPFASEQISPLLPITPSATGWPWIIRRQELSNKQPGVAVFMFRFNALLRSTLRADHIYNQRQRLDQRQADIWYQW